MLRDLQEISDGKIYGCNDMVRAACGDCAGCHACCEKMGTSIVLDPCDIWRLTTVTGKNFEQLLADTIELQVVDGVILPNLRMDGEKEQCVFLNEQGRCRIHAMRPGLCRVFPLGRIYEESRIRYFLQMDACQKPGRQQSEGWKMARYSADGTIRTVSDGLAWPAEAAGEAGERRNW